MRIEITRESKIAVSQGNYFNARASWLVFPGCVILWGAPQTQQTTACVWHHKMTINYFTIYRSPFYIICPLKTNLEIEFTTSWMVHFCCPFDWLRSHFSPDWEGWRRTEGRGPALKGAAMRARLCCASETMGADGWPAADVARPVTDACEREHPPMESISAAWQGLRHREALLA